MNSPAFTIAIALAMGMIAQTIARHIKIPGIVLLLAVGVLMGPDGLNIIRPELLCYSSTYILYYCIGTLQGHFVPGTTNTLVPLGFLIFFAF